MVIYGCIDITQDILKASNALLELGILIYYSWVSMMQRLKDIGQVTAVLVFLCSC